MFGTQYSGSGSVCGKKGGGDGDLVGKWDTGIRIGPGQVSAFVFACSLPPIGFAFVPTRPGQCRVSPDIIALFSSHSSRLSNRNCLQLNSQILDWSLSLSVAGSIYRQVAWAGGYLNWGGSRRVDRLSDQLSNSRAPNPPTQLCHTLKCFSHYSHY